MSEKVHEAIKEIDEFKKKIYERSYNMASTNKTTNYELSQFVETDKPGWLTDYNSDMRIIDSNLKSVSDVASGASGSLSALTDRVTAAEGAITTNANDIDALEARADVLEAQAQSMSGTIANIQTEQITQNAGIEAATELGYNLARPYDSASTYAVGDYVLFQNTLYKCITAVPVGEAFVPAKWLAIKATDEISAGGYTLPIASANTLGGVKVGSGLSIDALTGVLSAISECATVYTDSDVLTFGTPAQIVIKSSSIKYVKTDTLNILNGTITITNTSMASAVAFLLPFTPASVLDMPSDTINGSVSALGSSASNSINIGQYSILSPSGIYLGRASVSSSSAVATTDTTFYVIFIWERTQSI